MSHTNFLRLSTRHLGLEGLRWVPCPICRSTDFEKLAANDRYGMGVTTAGCKMCGLVMTNPQPSQEFLDEFYLKDYRVYYQKTDRPSESYIKKYGKDKRSADTAKFIEQSCEFSRIQDVLDIGASEGSLLRALRDLNPNIEAVAVEPSQEFREFSARHVPCITFSDSRSVMQTERKFDLIVINHVLEHIASPVIAMKDFATLLRPDGLLYVEVPDVTKYVGLESLHIAHLYHFSEVSLRKLLTVAGFEVLLVRRYVPYMHPPSIGVLLKRAPPGQVAQVAPFYDGWGELRGIDKVAWKYLLRQRLGRSRAARRLRKFVRYISNL